MRFTKFNKGSIQWWAIYLVRRRSWVQFFLLEKKKKKLGLENKSFRGIYSLLNKSFNPLWEFLAEGTEE